MYHFREKFPVFSVFLFFTLFATILSCTSKKESITITGQLLDSKSAQQFIVKKVLVDSTVAMDTVTVDSTGYYRFSLPADDNPIFYELQIKSWLTANFVADKQDLVIDFSTDTRTGTFNIEGGSKYTRTFRNEIFKTQRRYFFEQQKAIKKQNKVRDQYGKESPEYKQAKQLYNNTVSEVRAQIAEDLKRKINDLTKKESVLAPTAFTSVYQIRDNKQFAFVREKAKQFDTFAPDNVYTRGIRSAVDKILSVAQGEPAPNIDLSNPKGEKISLRSLRGQWVLIDFWASWCAPCRKENPELVRLYEKYQDKKFEIYGVSLDSDKKRWTGAIEKDNLNWVHVSDLSKWNSSAADQYAVKAIPAMFLISPEGIIEAKRPSIEELSEKLEHELGV